MAASTWSLPLPLPPPPPAAYTKCSTTRSMPTFVTNLPPGPSSSANALAAALVRIPAKELSLREVHQFHARLLRLGLDSDAHLSSHLVRLYCGHSCLDAARNLHHATGLLTPLAFNSLIRAYASSYLPHLAVDLFVEMLCVGIAPNEFTFPFALKACCHLGLVDLCRQIHAAVVKSGLFLSNVFCASAMLDFYAKLFPLGDALQLFERIPHRNEVTCNSMISAYLQNGCLEKGLGLLDEMVDSGLQVDASSWNSIIAGCVRSGDVNLALGILGEMILLDAAKPDSATLNTLLPVIPTIPSLYSLEELHGFCVRNIHILGVQPQDIDRLWSSIAMGYAYHGQMRCALSMRSEVKFKTSQLWNSIILGFLDCGKICDAFDAFRNMAFQFAHEAQSISKVSLTLLLPECHSMSKAGLEIHAYCYRTGMDTFTSVSNALIAMYSKQADIKSADLVFRMIPDKDVISWNTIIAMYVMAHDYDRTFDVFKLMLSEDVQPDEYSFSSVLNGCGCCSYLRQIVALHGHMIKSGFCGSFTVLQNSLMDAYGKCGCAEDAKKVFDETHMKDTISWNTIISCFGFSTFPHEALVIFHKMKELGWKPNRVTYVALLSACSHAGLLDKGLQYFEEMTSKDGIVPDVNHYTCIVDNLGRAGQLDRAYQFIKYMPIEPDDCIWSSLLGSCRVHGNLELAGVAAQKLIQLDPEHSGYWVLLSNIYADASRWRDVTQIRAAMKDAGVRKLPGLSWIEVGGSELHRFLNGDKLHKQSNDIYLALDGLTKQLKDEGYTPLLESKHFLLDIETQSDITVG